MYNTSTEYKNMVYEASTKHLLNIYIDGNKINPDYIFDFSLNTELFSNSEFSFGSVTSLSVEFKIFKNALPNSYETVYVESGINSEIIPLGYFTIEDIKEENEATYTIKATDYMMKFEFNYDGSILNYPATLLQVLQDICDKAGVELGSTSFLNMNKKIAVYDNTVSARTYLSYIAEQAGGFAIIGRDGKLYIKQIGSDVIEYDIKYFKDFSWGERFKISRTAYEDGIQNYKIGDETNNTVWINSNNMYIVDEEQIENIYNICKDFECYSFEGTSIIDPSLDIGDILIIDGKRVIYQGNLQYQSKFIANIKSTIQSKEKEETTRTITSQKTINRRVQSEINQIDGKITQLVEEQDEYDSKLSQITQDIDSINQQLKNTMDFTRTQSAKGLLHLNDCIAGNGYIIELSIRDVNYLTPSENLVPSEYLVPFANYFTLVVDKADKNNRTDEAFELRIDLDKSLLRLDDNTYDEILINDTGDMNLIRRVGRDTEGNLYKLDVEITENLGNVVLPTFESDTYIYVKENFNINFYTKWIIKSDFSDVYARKVELSSAIEQTTTSIMSEVNKKVNDTDFGTKIIQDFESVKIAWNQISQYIKMLGEDSKASLAIFDKNNKKITDFDSTGQHFYDNNDNIANMGIINLANDEADSREPGLFFTLDTSLLENGSMGWAYKTTNDDGTVVYYPYLWMGKRGDYQDVNLFLDVPLIAEMQSIKFTNGGIYDNISGVGIEIYNKFEILDKSDNTIFQIKKNNDGAGTITTDLISRHNYGDKYYEGYNVIEMTKEHKVMTSYSSNTGTIAFYADENFIDSIGMNISDKRLKYDFKNIDEKILKAIEDIEIQQFKFIDSDNKIHFGIIAQDLIEIFNKYGINPEEYDVLKSFKRKVSDDTTYYKIEYTQFLVLKQLATDYKIKKQQEEIDVLKEKINLLLKERSTDNGENNI